MDYLTYSLLPSAIRLYLRTRTKTSWTEQKMNLLVHRLQFATCKVQTLKLGKEEGQRSCKIEEEVSSCRQIRPALIIRAKVS